MEPSRRPLMGRCVQVPNQNSDCVDGCRKGIEDVTAGGLERSGNSKISGPGNVSDEEQLIQISSTKAIWGMSLGLHIDLNFESKKLPAKDRPPLDMPYMTKTDDKLWPEVEFVIPTYETTSFVKVGALMDLRDAYYKLPTDMLAKGKLILA